MIILFLDDMPEREAQVRPNEELFYVRNFDEFKEWLQLNGTPDIISFDHDLAPEHYHALKTFKADSDVPDGKTCARWAIANGFIPKVAIVHSWNPEGAKEIANILAEGGVPMTYLQMFHPLRLHIPERVYQ